MLILEEVKFEIVGISGLDGIKLRQSEIKAGLAASFELRSGVVLNQNFRIRIALRVGLITLNP